MIKNYKMKKSLRKIIIKSRRNIRTPTKNITFNHSPEIYALSRFNQLRRSYRNSWIQKSIRGVICISLKNVRKLSSNADNFWNGRKLSNFIVSNRKRKSAKNQSSNTSMRLSLSFWTKIAKNFILFSNQRSKSIVNNLKRKKLIKRVSSISKPKWKVKIPLF